MGDSASFERMKKNASAVVNAVCDSVRKAVLEDEKALAMETADDMHKHCTHCAAAALIEAKVSAETVKKLLIKYFRVDNEQADIALAEGLIMVGRKNGKEGNPKKG